MGRATEHEKRTTRRKLLSVGINYEGQPIRLRGCINDAKEAARLMCQRFGISEQDTRLIHDNTEVKPTRENLLEAFEWLVGGAGPGDLLYFHYSGHGAFTFDQNSEEADKTDESIVPLDYRKSGFIQDNELRKRLAERVPEDATLVCTMDCCYSGTGLDLRYNYLTTCWKRYVKPGGYVFGHGDVKYSCYDVTRGNVFLVSGSLEHETAADAYEDGRFIGALTFALLTIFEKDPKRNLSFKKLSEEMVTILRDEGYRQTPQISSGRPFSPLNQFPM